MKVGILGVTGYSGMELARILHRHPDSEIACVTSRSAAGKKLGEAVPQLSALDLTIAEELNESVDIVFSALPQTASAESLGRLLDGGVKAVDISADFRLRSADEYREWYKEDHPCPQYLEEAVYGLTELNRDEVVSARLVANPGCYPTAIILALAPAIRAGIIQPDIIADAKTGVSGAGRKVELQYVYSEVNENVRAYSVEGHRHLPEITQELGRINGSAALRLTFVPHLVPMTRGILATCYAPLREDASPKGEVTRAWVRQVYEDFYQGERFVDVVDHSPMTKHTLGNNNCAIYPTVDLRSNRLIVISCIDNLVKGAAGQAVQNMNVMFGLPEAEGLEQLALYP